VLDVLDPEGGVRVEKLTKVMTDFNGRLGRLSGSCGFPKVEIGSDMVGRAGGRPYPLLSESEKLRFDIIVRVALAQGGIPGLVCVDRFDSIQPQDRGAILKMLHAAKIPCLIGMMAQSRESVPKVEKAGIGRAYWLDNHTTERISAVEEAA
jgi:hypothetical protein